VIARAESTTRRQALYDDAIAADAIDLLANDRRTEHLDLSVTACRAVLHVTGDVASDEERELVRRLLRRVGGVRAAWDLVTVGDRELVVADVGCGATKQVDGAIGIDVVPLPGVDVVATVDERLPFADNSFDHVFAVHVLEHVDDMVRAMAELHRVLRPTGLLHVLAPWWRHVNAAGDPTHRHPVDVQTIAYFCREGPTTPTWRPLIALQDEATVYADLAPVIEGDPPPEDRELARFFH
jgi:SAM-dependent methyltransferase